jgi:serine protease Do
VKEVGSFRNEVALTPPGSRERLTIVREGQQRNLEVTIGMLRKEKRLGQGSAQSAAELGLTVQTLTFELAEQFNAKPGESIAVTAVQPGSIAALAGIEPGAVIFEVNRKGGSKQRRRVQARAWQQQRQAVAVADPQGRRAAFCGAELVGRSKQA